MLDRSFKMLCLQLDADMRRQLCAPYSVAGFIVPYQCSEVKRKNSTLDRNKMRVRKGKLRLSPNEEAQLIKEETEKRRKLRLQQVREQSKENAAKIRHAVKQEKHRQLMKLANEIKGQLEEEKAERVRHLERQYDNSLRHIGVGHKEACEQPDRDEDRALLRQTENLRADSRGRSALEKEKRDIAEKKQEARKHVVARKNALEVEKQRSAEIAAMPPPPPDPLQNINTAKQKPVKVTDMEHFSTSHYHLQNEHVIDKAGPQEQEDAREAAELEAVRIKDRALELKRLRQDQLERARLRHNQALERELLKHDYNNILHDLSDLQREDRERRLKVVHNIPKQVFEPPNFRMDDRDDKQRQMEQDFEDMYMAGTDYQGDINMTLGPTPHPGSQTTDESLDVTLTENGTPLREPTLPDVPPVLRDMTNMPKAKAPGTRPEKVLRGLMDKIKSQREDWINSHSRLEVGEPSLQQGPEIGEFVQMIPEESPVPVIQTIPAAGNQIQPGSQFNRPAAMPPAEFSAHLRAANDRQQTNLQVEAQTIQQPPQSVDIQQIELAEIMKQQEIILEQKKQLELKLQQLSQEQQKFQMSGGVPGQIPAQAMAQPLAQQPLNPSAMSSVNGPASTLQGQGQYQNGLPKQQTNLQLSAAQTTEPVQLSNGIPGQPTAQQQQSVLNQQYLQQQQQFLLQQQQQQQLEQQKLAQQLQQQQAPPPVLPQQHFVNSLSSSGMSSQHPMNSIPPTGTTSSVPMATMAQGHPRPVRSAYQPASAVLTTDQLGIQSQPQIPAQSQLPQYNSFHTQMAPNVNQQMAANTNQYQPSMVSNISSINGFSTIQNGSMATDLINQRAPFPGHVTPGSLTSETHNSQMQKIREYQQQLLMRHEQSKKVLEETKAEIKKRKENLMQRYPKLDLSRLEDLGAKYLQNRNGEMQTSVNQSVSVQQETRPDPSQVNAVLQDSLRTSQGVPVTQLLASLASHPYYKATLSQPGPTNTGVGSQPQPATHITIGSVHIAQPHPSIADNTNLRKNKLDGVRKSLPFDADESLPNRTPVRVYEAYSEKHMDTTSGTEQTDQDTSAVTDKDSPAFKNMSVAEDTDVDTTMSGSFLSDKKDPATARQEELRDQLLEIQRHREEITRIQEMGQQKLQQRENEVKQKLASLNAPKPEDSQPVKDQVKEQTSVPQIDLGVQNEYQAHNLSTIMEVDTPVSTRPSDTGRLSTSSTDSGSVSYPQPMKKALDYGPPAQHKLSAEVIAEEPRLEEVETQMQKQKQTTGNGETVADYSGKNIDNVLERAKRFEAEVLEKLKKQTKGVLYDNEFDDSLEFNTSRPQVSTDKLSSGSLSPESFSTGPLEDTTINKSLDPASKSATAGKTWADELSQYKARYSGNSDKSFKLLQPESGQEPTGDQNVREDTIFSGDVNRFVVYSKINESEQSDGSYKSSNDSRTMLDKKSEASTLNADDMLSHLRKLQQQLRDEGEAREALAKRLDQVQHQSTVSNKSDEQKHSNDDHVVSTPFMPDSSKSDLSQYSLTDKSTDTSLNDVSRGKITYESPVQSGTSSKERQLPVRRSPVGDHARSRSQSPALAGNHPVDQRQEVTSSEYSFGPGDANQRSTSTPGDERRKSSLAGQPSIVNKSELPSEITVGEKSVNKTNTGAVRFSTEWKPMMHDESTKSSGHSKLSTYTASNISDSSKFATMSPEKTNESTGADLTTYSMSSAEDSLRSMKEQFQRLAPESSEREKIKTFAVNRNGDLISEMSDSDRSSGNFLTNTNENLTSYSIPTKNDSYGNGSNFGLSSYSLNDPTSEDKRQSQLSQYTMKSSATTDSSPRSSNPQSSSLTNVTSDPSFNASGLSQYTIADKTDNSLKNSNTNESNYLQQKFASLDNLIIESKSLIVRHKVIINKNKEAESDVAPPIPSSLPPPLKSRSKADYSEDQEILSTKSIDHSLPSNDSSKLSKISSFNDSSKSGDRSSQMDFKELDYVVENSTGISEEPMPDLSTMTLGSDLSITEAFQKVELSDSNDSLQSFERHEMSECESVATSHAYDDESRSELTASGTGKSDSLQEIVEARKHNFMVQSERVAAAAKERALSQRNKPDDNHPVFRAVPVNVVSAPTLSMSVNVPGAEKGRPPSPLQIKSTKSVSDAKKAFEMKEKESGSPVGSKLPLNRALQPRGPDSPRQDSTEKQTSSGVSGLAKDLSGGSRFTRSLSSPASPGKSALLGEIKNFGGSSGFDSKPKTPSPAKKTPPKVLPKPVRSKVGFSPTKTESTKSTKPSTIPATSGFSKTLSSWKKSRAITGPPKSAIPEPVTNRDAPKNSIRVLPKEAPVLLTEEEKRLKMEEEQYEKNIRLQHKFDTTDDADTSQDKSMERPKETKKDTARNARK